MDSEYHYHGKQWAQILVAAHKPCWVPADHLYRPVQVGAVGKDAFGGFDRDDVGINISDKNCHFSELTALYWGWKNLDVDYLGLVHYRRLFAGTGKDGILTVDDLFGLLELAPVIVPRARNYYIDSLESHYGHTFDPQHFMLLREAINAVHPAYSGAFERHVAGTRAHMFNMFVMRRDLADGYCSWLFPLLDYVDLRIDYSTLTEFEARAVGRLAERMLDVWLEHNGLDSVECPVTNLEGSHFLKKGVSFFGAKFLGKKYEKSF